MFEEIIEHGPYIIRPFKTADASDVPLIVFKVLMEYGLVPDPDGVDSDLFNIETDYKNGYFGVVEYKETLVGTFGLSFLENNYCEVRKMYLLAEHRGRGIGRRILENLLALAKKSGCIVAELETASVLKEAVHLYEKIGFKLVPKTNATIRCNRVYTLDLTKI